MECPPYTEGLLLGLVECPCIKGYHKARSDRYSRMCTRPPSSPTNLTLTKVYATTATLSWSPPLDNGGSIDTWYRVSCDTCGSFVTFNPVRTTEKTSWVALNPDLRTFRQTS